MDSSNSSSPITGSLSDLTQPSEAPQQSAPQPGGAITGNISEFGNVAATKDDDQIQPGDSIGTKFGKGAKAFVHGPLDVLEGVGEGLFSTAAGASDIADKVAGWQPGNANKALHQLAGDGEKKNFGQQLGFGGETLIEFLMGDEAIKLLPTMAAKLDAVSKIMGILEKSPKLLQALKTGTAPLSKTVSFLASEGYVPEVARMGVVQGAQTTDRTGGDLKQGAEDAALTAGTGAVLNPAIAKVGKFFSKAGVAADTVSSMGQSADQAPSKSDLFGGIGGKLNQAKSDIESFFADAKQTAEDTRASGIADADKTKAADSSVADQKLADRKDQAVEMAQGRRVGDASTDTRQGKIQQATEAAKKYTQTQLVSGLDKLAGAGPEATDELAEKVNEGINDYEKSAHEKYESGLNDEENGVISRLEGQSIPVKESPISEKAGELLNTPNPADHPAVANMKQSAGDALDASVKQQLTELKNGMIEKVTGEGKEAVKQQIPMADWTAKDLVDFRQAVRAKAASYMRGDINRRVLGQLMESIDDTLGAMAGHSGQPEVMSDYADLRKGYREQRSLLDSNTADKLKLTSPDKALDDVNKYLTGGSNGVAKLETIRKIVGDGTMQELANSKVAQWKEVATQNPAKFVKEFNAMKPEIRQSFFGPEMASKLEDLADTYTHASGYADAYGKSLLETEKGAGAASKDTTRKLFGNTGYGEKQLNGLVGEGIKNAHATEIADISSRFDDAVNAAKDAYQSAINDLKPGEKMKDDMFSGSFMKDLMEGRTNESLLKGDVDPQDIQKLKTVIGNDHWQGISDGIFQRAVSDATDNGRFDPQKLAEWWTNIAPETRTELFSLDQPENAKKLDDVMSKVKDSADVKRMVKWWVGFPVVAGAGAAAGATLGHLRGPIGELIGGLAGLGGVKLATRALEWFANHPQTWNALRKGSQIAASPTAKVAATAAPYLGGKAIKSVYGALTGSLAR